MGQRAKRRALRVKRIVAKNLPLGEYPGIKKSSIYQSPSIRNLGHGAAWLSIRLGGVGSQVQILSLRLVPLLFNQRSVLLWCLFLPKYRSYRADRINVVSFFYQYVAPTELIDFCGLVNDAKPRLVSEVEPWLVSEVEPRLVSEVEPPFTPSALSAQQMFRRGPAPGANSGSHPTVLGFRPGIQRQSPSNFQYMVSTILH
jgi:hypothetical protein